jgi:hypothetical protein
MKTIVKVFAASLSLAFIASATNDAPPRAEAFFGYNFVRFNPNSNFIPNFNANGGSGQFVYNFWHGLGVAFDAGAVNKGVLNGTNADITVINFVAGPRYAFHHWGRVVPFAEALFGGAYATASAQLLALPLTPPLGVITLPPDVPVTARLTASHTGFAMLVGGGVDIKVARRVAFRPAAFDYYLTRMPTFFTGQDSNRNNWRYSAGVNFWFGAQ